MYGDRVACCSLVSHVDYAPTGQTDGRKDARPLHYAFCVMLGVSSLILTQAIDTPDKACKG